MNILKKFFKIDFLFPGTEEMEIILEVLTDTEI